MNPITPHQHNDTDSPKLVAQDSLVGAPATALTASTGTTAGATYTTAEQAIVNNLITRVNELEARLQTLTLLK